jgi:hypothetical protein
MTRARLEHVPAVPHDINDVSIRGLWKRTWSEDRFLLYKDNDWGILNRPPRVYGNFLVGFKYLDSDHRGRKHLFVDWPYIPSSSNANI